MNKSYFMISTIALKITGLFKEKKFKVGGIPRDCLIITKKKKKIPNVKLTKFKIWPN